MATKEVQKDMATSSSVERTRDQAVYRPNVDIIETNNEVLVVADMSGVDEKSVSVTLEDDILTLEGFVAPRIKGDYRAEIREYGVGNYERSFRMSSDIDASAIEAKVKNGVLRVILPKAEKAKRRVIAVAGD